MVKPITGMYCDRCGTRHEFERARTGGLARIRGLGRGLRAYVLNESPTLDDAMADAWKRLEEDGAARQLTAAHKAFSFCIDCRGYVCHECWNAEAGRCLTCVPLPGMPAGEDRIAARLDTVAGRVTRPTAGVPPAVEAAATSVEVEVMAASGAEAPVAEVMAAAVAPEAVAPPEAVAAQAEAVVEAPELVEAPEFAAAAAIAEVEAPQPAPPLAEAEAVTAQTEPTPAASTPQAEPAPEPVDDDVIAAARAAGIVTEPRRAPAPAGAPAAPRRRAAPAPRRTVGPVHCRHCGLQVPAVARFCRRCGGRQADVAVYG